MKQIITSAFVFLFFFLNLYGQDIDVQINITADEFPQDISWEIRNQFSEIVYQGRLDGCEPFQTCSDNFQLENECFVFIIKDDFGDGINQPGGYEVLVNGTLQGMGSSFVNNDQIEVNCFTGESCRNAVVLDLPDNNILAPKNKDYWFKLIPEVSGLYRMNTCLNFITGQGYANTIMWVYDTCDALIHQNGAEGALGFSDDSSQCSPASGFNYVPLEQGKEYLIRTRVVDQTWPVDSITVRVQKLPPLSGCTDPMACNFNPFASAENGSCVYNDDCRPDLSLDADELKNSIVIDSVYNSDECLVEEGCLSGNGWRDVIKFSTKIDNIGSADYIVGIPERTPQNFSKENCHGHWHHLGYAEYLLFAGSGQPEPIGFKNGFCVLDLDCESDTPKYLCSYMGITAGCSDIYDNEIDCQWIDITDIEDGQYTLVVRVNWNRLADMRNFQEMTYDNNWGQVCIDIDRSSGELVVNVLENCAAYTDCLGIPFGQAEIDCNGMCGGNAEFGDLNGNAELDSNDVAIYLDLIHNKLQSNLPCTDLSGDGLLSVYDASLLNECMLINIDQADNPFHTHCTFPVERKNANESVEISIAEFDPSNGMLSLDIRIPDNDIQAFQLPFSGIVIDSIQKLYGEEASFIKHNQNEVIAFHDSEVINRNPSSQPFLNIYFSEIISDSLCIEQTLEFVNNDYELVNTIVDNSCLFLTSNSNLSAAYNCNIYPNPATGKVTVTSDQNMGYIEIYNITGSLLCNIENINSNSKSIDIELLPEGLYILKTGFSSNAFSISKFIKE